MLFIESNVCVNLCVTYNDIIYICWVDISGEIMVGVGNKQEQVNWLVQTFKDFENSFLSSNTINSKILKQIIEYRCYHMDFHHHVYTKGNSSSSSSISNNQM